MRVRLVPVGEIFRRMPFVVRDLARETGKRVRLELRGQETEIDKFLIERMMDPVLHLVRNAVSHGFEPPAERLAAGKPEEGTLTLAAASVGESVVLEIADDGRGIDADGGRGARARDGLAGARGPARRARRSSTCSARPGFSTRDETDRASGRGVGMASSRRTVEELNGHHDARHGARRRHAVRHRAAADAVDHRRADRPRRRPHVRGAAGGVREVVEIDRGAVRADRDSTRSRRYRGGILPIVRLAASFGVAAASASRACMCSSSARARPPSASPWIASSGSARSWCGR